jgi:FkbM family methyltransferase
MNGFSVFFNDRNQSTYILKEIFSDEVYYFKHDGDHPVIVDAGANIGIATLYFKHLYPEARITCFEPARATYKRLMDNIYYNSLNDVNAYNVALSDYEGETTFNYKPTHDGGSSLVTASGGVDETVKVEKLSKYINGNVDLLKLDVEGSEINILSDLKNNDKLHNVRSIIGEYHNYILGDARIMELCRILDKAGFVVNFKAMGNPNLRINLGEDCTMFYAKRS